MFFLVPFPLYSCLPPFLSYIPPVIILSQSFLSCTLSSSLFSAGPSPVPSPILIPLLSKLPIIVREIQCWRLVFPAGTVTHYTVSYTHNGTEVMVYHTLDEFNPTAFPFHYHFDFVSRQPLPLKDLNAQLIVNVQCASNLGIG